MSEMRIFISGPFRKKEHQIILETIKKTISSMGHNGFIGAYEINNYGKISMSKSAFWLNIIKEIRNSDLILIDLRDEGSGFGRAMEAGIAKALGKKVILLYPPKFKTDECIEEIADKIISYKNLDDLKAKLKKEPILK